MYVFEKDKTVKEVGLCAPCMKSTIADFVAPFFNPALRAIDQAKLATLNTRLAALPATDSNLDPATSEAWPSVPLGALMWVLCSSKREVAPVTKAWLTGTCEITVRNSGHLITCCPNHPAIAYRMPPALRELKCTSCNFILCKTCRRWHANTQVCDADPPGTKRCPFCNLPVVKTQGCNHITCPCGKHWCYVCRAGYNTGNEVYTHMKSVHGGWFT
jgi:hypothetical protein